MRRYYHRRFLHNEVPAIVRLWLFRLLVPLAGHREFVERGGLSSDPLAEVLGLTIDPALDAYSRPSAFSDLRKLHRQEERKSSRARIPKSVVRNVGRLSDLVGLTECDR